MHYLRCKGAYVIDADKLTHKAMEPDGPAYAAIVKTFGPAIVGPVRRHHRRRWGASCLAILPSCTSWRRLSILLVFALTKEELAQTNARLVVVEAIKLLESRRLLTLCKEVWVVTATQTYRYGG